MGDLQAMQDMDTSYNASDYFADSKADNLSDKYLAPATPIIKGALSPLAAVQLRPPPPCELTPPPSPERQPSPLSWKEQGQGLLQRAATMASRRTSPERAPAAARRHKSKASIGAFGELFSGSSAPINLGLLPAQRKETAGDDQSSESGSLSRPTSHRRGGSFQVAASLLGLASRTTLSKGRGSRRIAEEDGEDEILNLDLESELFPLGISGQGALPAEAYDDLLANASRLFLRMQDAYREQHSALREVKASATFDQEELDEARTRAKHLKLQLDGMSTVVAEQEADVKNLKAELQNERDRRRLEHELRRNTVRLVQGSTFGDMATLESPSSSTHGLGALDLGGAEIDSDEESEHESVFSKNSRGRSSASSTMQIEQNSAESMAPWLAPAGSSDEEASDSAEVQRLKARIIELEETVQGCLGLVA